MADHQFELSIDAWKEHEGAFSRFNTFTGGLIFSTLGLSVSLFKTPEIATFISSIFCLKIVEISGILILFLAGHHFIFVVLPEDIAVKSTRAKMIQFLEEGANYQSDTDIVEWTKQKERNTLNAVSMAKQATGSLQNVIFWYFYGIIILLISKILTIFL